MLNVDTPLHRNEDKFTITLRNANGEILFEAGPGLIVREDATSSTNEAARQIGGISRVTLRAIGAHGAHGDRARRSRRRVARADDDLRRHQLAAALFTHKNVWTRRQFGWILRLRRPRRPPVRRRS